MDVGSGTISLVVTRITPSMQVMLVWFLGRLKILLCHQYIISAAPNLYLQILDVSEILAVGNVVLMVGSLDFWNPDDHIVWMTCFDIG